MLLDILFTFTALNDYFAIAIAIFFSLLISLVLFGVVTLLTYKQYDVEKTASFECGFHPFEDTREKFNIRFYLVSILFIIFDLEITYLFPWALNLRNIDFIGFWCMFLFLFILTLGFVYEWVKGALDWE